MDYFSAKVTASQGRASPDSDEPASLAKRNLFLALPVELRTRIYEVHFELLRLVEVPANWRSVEDDFGPWNDQQPPITRVSRQIRAESLPTFYSFCTFAVLGICATCYPDVHRIMARHAQGKPSNPFECPCLAHRCYHFKQCHSRRANPWHWILAIGDKNLSHIRSLQFTQQGDPLVGHKGYEVNIEQHPRTKYITISERSFWQDDHGEHPRKIKGSEPDGQAIIDEIHNALDDDDEAEAQGLTAALIHKILSISDRRSFLKRRSLRTSTLADHRSWYTTTRLAQS